MDLDTILRTLLRRRRLVAIVAGISILIGLFATYSFHPPAEVKTRRYTVALGQTRLLVDTRASQVVALYPPKKDGSDGGPTEAELINRASLLSNLVGTGPIKAAIAKRAGIPPRDLTIIPAQTDAQATAALSPTSLEALQSKKIDDRVANILTVRSDPTLPVISVDAQAPQSETAARLANATVSGLRDFLGSIAAAQKIPEARQIVIRQLGLAQVGTAVRGPSRLNALILTLFVFAAGCAFIAFAPAVRRKWQEVLASEDVDDRPVRDDGGDRLIHGTSDASGHWPPSQRPGWEREPEPTVPAQQLRMADGPDSAPSNGAVALRRTGESAGATHDYGVREEPSAKPRKERK